MRIGDYRVVYVLKGEEIWVLAIIHRKEDYHGLEKRLSWLPR
jgi:mRNA-degrading endonuclease RelE of RelBE toxin-antitoxin system